MAHCSLEGIISFMTERIEASLGPSAIAEPNMMVINVVEVEEIPLDLFLIKALPRRVATVFADGTTEAAHAEPAAPDVGDTPAAPAEAAEIDTGSDVDMLQFAPEEELGFDLKHFFRFGVCLDPHHSLNLAIPTPNRAASLRPASLPRFCCFFGPYQVLTLSLWYPNRPQMVRKNAHGRRSYHLTPPFLNGPLHPFTRSSASTRPCVDPKPNRPSLPST